MTKTSETFAPKAGESANRNQRSKFWSFIGLGIIGAAAVGFASGSFVSMAKSGTVPLWGIYPVMGAALAFMLWFTVSYFRRVDELDLMDNLWACMIGFYFYFLVLPCWQLLHDVGLADLPNQWHIWMASLAVMTAAYLWRRFRTL